MIKRVKSPNVEENPNLTSHSLAVAPTWLWRVSVVRLVYLTTLSNYFPSFAPSPFWSMLAWQWNSQNVTVPSSSLSLLPNRTSFRLYIYSPASIRCRRSERSWSQLLMKPTVSLFSIHFAQLLPPFLAHRFANFRQSTREASSSNSLLLSNDCFSKSPFITFSLALAKCLLTRS